MPIQATYVLHTQRQHYQTLMFCLGMFAVQAAQRLADLL